MGGGAEPKSRPSRLAFHHRQCPHETETFVSKDSCLTEYYADRSLLKRPVTPADQAEAFFLLLTQRLGQTTGQIITVDGGLHEAFLR